MGAGANWRGTATAVVLLAALAPGGAARADSPADQAKLLARRSIREYETGELEAALADAVEAFKLSGAPELLYNLGQCHRALEHWKQAEFSYRNYLHDKPNAPNRAAVVKLIAEMQARQARSSGTPALAPTPPPPATPPPVAPAPAAAVTTAPPPPVAEATASPPPGRSHALAWTFWGASAVAGGFAIAGAVRVGDYQSGASPSSYSGYESELATRTNASNWGTAAIVLGSLAVAGVVGGVLAW